MPILATRSRRAGTGRLVQVGHAHHLAGAQAGQGQDPADVGVGLDDVVGHLGVGEAGQGPQDQVAGGAGGPEDGPGRPDLGLQAGQDHLGQPLQAGRPDDLGRQVAQALRRLHAAGQAPPHRLQVAGHRAQLVLDPEHDRGLQVAPGQPSRGRAERVGRGPDRPAQPHGQQHQGGQHHQGGAQGQGLGGLIGPVLAAGIGPLRLGQLVLQGRLAGPQLLEVAVGVAGGDGPGGRPGPALPRLPLGLPGPDPGPVLGRHLLHQREQAPPAAAQLLDPVETLGGADLGLVAGVQRRRVAGDQVRAPARLHGHEVAAEPGRGPAQLVDPVDGGLERDVGPGRVAGAQEDGRPPRHHQHAEQGEQDGELHPQAPHP